MGLPGPDVTDYSGRARYDADMDSSQLRAITLAAIDVETAGLVIETHPQIQAAHRAAIKDLKDRLHAIENSTRLADKAVVAV